MEQQMQLQQERRILWQQEQQEHRKCCASIGILLSVFARHVKCLKLQHVANNEIILAIAEKCNDLESLTLVMPVGVTSLTLRVLFENNPRIQKLDFMDALSLTAPSFIHAANFCKQLQEVRLSECHNINNAGIKALVTGCRELRVLIFNRCSLLTETTLVAISNNCAELRTLGVSGCTSISNTDAILEAAKVCPKLLRLEIDPSAQMFECNAQLQQEGSNLKICPPSLTMLGIS